MEEALAKEGEDLMLFLQHVHTVVFSKIPPGGKELVEELRVTTELTGGDAKQDFQARLSQAMDGNSPTPLSYTMTVKNSSAETTVFPVTKRVLPIFQDIVREVYKRLRHACLPLVPEYHEKSPGSTVTITWASPGGGDMITELYFLEEMPGPEVQKVLQQLNMKLIPAFTHLQQIHEEFIEAQVNSVV
ncbi:hypothetical protein Nmel_014843 [Mimus melanotis]